VSNAGDTLSGTELVIGAVLHPEGATADTRYLVTDAGDLAQLTPLAYQLYLLGSGAFLGGEREVSPAQVAALRTADPAGGIDWPKKPLVSVDRGLFREPRRPGRPRRRGSRRQRRRRRAHPCRRFERQRRRPHLPRRRIRHRLPRARGGRRHRRTPRLQARRRRPRAGSVAAVPRHRARAHRERRWILAPAGGGGK
jgi:hypothetical protein